MGNSIYAPILGIVGYLVAKWALDRFKITNKALRIVVIILVPATTVACIVAAPRLIEGYAERHSASYGQRQFEATVFKEYPSFKVIAENEPALWEKVREEMVGVYQANGSQMDTKVAQQMAAIFRPLNERLKKVGAAADDDHILNSMTAESTLINHLMQENVALCAGHLLGTSFDQTEPSQLTVSLQRQVQAAMMEAYVNGLDTRAKIPTEGTGVGLIQRAIGVQTNPFSAAEITALQSPNSRTPADICRAWKKLYSNALTFNKQDAANFMRYLLTSS